MEINRNAPAWAAAEITIDAPVSLVWTVLTDLEHWPAWNTEVTKMDLRGPLAPESRFDWKAGGAPIRSVLREVEPDRRIVWTGRMLGIRAVHVWSFEPSGSGTRVRTEESFDGLMARLLAGPMKRMLETSLGRGLELLNAECERRAGG